jgi:hypothetical protein
MFETVADGPDMEYAMADANRQSPPSRSGRKRGTQSQAIGHSKGGLTTKILALADALGNLVRFVLLPGYRYDTVGVALLIRDVEFQGLIADKAFDADWIIDELNERGRVFGYQSQVWWPKLPASPAFAHNTIAGAARGSRNKGPGYLRNWIIMADRNCWNPWPSIR